MKRSIQLVALLLTVFMGSCTGGKDKAAAEHVDAKPIVKLADVKARPVDQIQDYTATVEAEVKNNIAPSSPVRIDQIFVEVGDRVSKGQKLVQMDAANLKQTKLQLDNQEIEFNRIDELYKVGGASKSEWDASKMQLDVKKTAYKNLLENTSLQSPINGVVTARNYDNGDMYSGGEPVLVVEQITPASSKRLGEHVLEHESEIERAIIAVQTARHRNVVATRQHPRVRLIQLEVPRVFRGLERLLRIAYHVAIQADMGRN